MMQFVISVLGIYVFNFLFIIIPLSTCHSITVFSFCLFSFYSLYDRSIVVLSLFLFILVRSIYSHTFHLFSYIQAEHDRGAIPVRNTNLNQRIFHDNQSTEQFHRINSAEQEQEQKFLYMKLR